MVIAKFKCTFILLWFIILAVAPPAAAATQWEITWQDNNNLLETVLIKKDTASFQPPGWKYAQTAEGLQFRRSVKDWQVYDRQADKLPIKVAVRDYLLFKTITFKALPADAPAHTLAGLAQMQPMDLSISVPGLIRTGSADEVKEVTAVWHLKDANELHNRGQMLVVNTFDGFLLGMLILILGILIIGLVFISRVRKTHKLIDQEYSLENLTLPTEQSEETK